MRSPITLFFALVALLLTISQTVAISLSIEGGLTACEVTQFVFGGAVAPVTITTTESLHKSVSEVTMRRGKGVAFYVDFVPGSDVTITLTDATGATTTAKNLPVAAGADKECYRWRLKK